MLAFQLAHARARDAVHRSLDITAFASLNPVLLHSAAADRAIYLRRPDLGRRLDPESATRIKRGQWDLAVIVADGLSATGVNRHAMLLIDALMPEIAGWRVAPICLVEQGRVAIGDEIGERFGAKLAIVLIGERPGLSSPDSLGAYLTWSPRVGRTDAERNCVSNIRTEGLDPAVASRRIAFLMRAARDQQVTGVHLKMTDLLN